eukprot:COSAG03_NODE_1056_length_4941_cov_2.134655_1_plen_94_part_10
MAFGNHRAAETERQAGRQRATLDSSVGLARILLLESSATVYTGYSCWVFGRQNVSGRAAIFLACCISHHRSRLASEFHNHNHNHNSLKMGCRSF